MLSLNAAPYFDDFDASKNYHKILFVPGNPVQARELTQIQSMLQHQIKLQGDHLFQNGTMVIPGNVFYDTRVVSIKLEKTYNGVDTDTVIEGLVDSYLIGVTSGVKAKVIYFQKSTTDLPPLIFIKYVASNGTNQFFTASEGLFVDPEVELIPSNTTPIILISSADDYHNVASLCYVSEGVFYLNGYFIGVDNQTIVVTEFDPATVTSSIGLTLVENIVTAQDDPTLFDNAQGYNNYSAPGADRYQLQLVLTKVDYGSTQDQSSFIKLLDVRNGDIQYLNNRTKYSEVEKMLAKRTYDESGDYTISRDIIIKAEHLRNNFRGQWMPRTFYMPGDVVFNTASDGVHYYYTDQQGYSGATGPTHLQGRINDGSIFWSENRTPYLNSGAESFTVAEDILAADTQLLLTVEPIKAYVRGHEIDTLNTSFNVNKPRTIKYKRITQKIDAGQYILVTGIDGYLDTSQIQAATIKNHLGTTIGSCFLGSLEWDSGAHDSTGTYRLYAFDISIDTGYDFTSHAASINISTTFVADIQLKEFELSGVVDSGEGGTAVTGKLTRFLTELTVGSKVKIGATTTTVDVISTDFSMVVAASVTVTDSVAIQYYAEYVNNGTNNVIQLPDFRLNSVRNESDVLDMTYTTVQYKSAGTVAEGNTSCEVTLTSSNELFVDTPNHVVFNRTTGEIIAGTCTLSNDSTVLTVTGLPAAGVGGEQYSIAAIIRRQADPSKEKTKITKTKVIVLDGTRVYNFETGAEISTEYTFKSKSFGLSEADLIRVISVRQSGDGATDPYNATGETDISSRYFATSGVMENYYSEATLNINGNAQIPTAPIKVTFEYFDHSNGDFFSRNSYITVIDEMIPTIKGTPFSLGEVLDFRSRMDDAGTGFNTGNGASVSTPLYSQSLLEVTYSYYLPRHDILYLGIDGVVHYIEGQPSDFSTLTFPSVTNEGMVVATIFVAPNIMYPVAEFLYDVHKIKNYTMRDIGKLETRLENVEQYVTLNMIEKNIIDMNIKDEHGLDRFKSGFVVDNFTDANVSELNSIDFKADVSPAFAPNTLRPQTSLSYVKCVKPEISIAVAPSYYGTQITGSTLSLPYTVEAAISQMVASGSEFINPFNVVVYEGELTVLPKEDIWETTSKTTKTVFV